MPPVSDDLLEPETLRNPFGVLAALRDDAPVRWSDRYRAWIVTGYEASLEVYTSPAFSSDRIRPVLERVRAEGGSPQLIATLEVLAGWMVFHDGGEHLRLRHHVRHLFTPRSIALWRERVAEVASGLLDGIEGEFDLVARVALPLPAMVMAELLGAPPGDRGRFAGWSEDIAALVFGAVDDEGRHERAVAGMTELAAYLGALVTEKRAAPGDDAISATLGDGPGGPLSDDEVVAMCTLLLFAGSETTTNLIANGVLALIRHPGQAAALLQRPELCEPAIEELLRFDGPSRMNVRIAARDTELAGARVRAGDRLLLATPAANRDPGRFDRPDVLDITRSPNPHLGFGFGPHYCLGAALARIEAQVTIPLVLRRLGPLELADEPLEYEPTLLSRSLRRLPVRRAEAQPAPDGGSEPCR